MIRPVVALAAALMAAAVPAAAQQQIPCTERGSVVEFLANKFSETPVAIGLSSNGGVIEVLSSRKGGSWTIIVTTPDGTACMLASGQDWQALPKTAVLGPGA